MAPIIATRALHPTNEYTENYQLLTRAYPTVFLLGQAFAFTGPLRLADTAYLFNHYTNRPAHNIQLVHFLANQRMRTQTAQAVSTVVVSKPASMLAVREFVQSDAKRQLLTDAAANPDGDAARQVWRTLGPHIRVIGQHVDFSPAQRSAVAAQIHAAMVSFGLPSIFITIALDDTSSPLSIRLLFPAQSMGAFPAAGADVDVFLAALAAGEPFRDIKLSRPELVKYLAANPVAAARMFQLTIETVVTDLFGLELMHASGGPAFGPAREPVRTDPDKLLRKGIFGTAIAFHSVIEAQVRALDCVGVRCCDFTRCFCCVLVQGRGTLHVHGLYWGGLSPRVMQLAAGTALQDHVATVLESMINAEMGAAEHVRAALLQRAHDAAHCKGNAVYKFGPGHELVATHAQRVVSKRSVPMAVGFPTCPMQPPADAPSQRQRRHDAKRVQQQIALLTMHTSWSVDHAEVEFEYNPASVQRAFTDWMQRLCSPDASFRDRCVRETVFNQIHGISNDASRRMALRAFRARDADVLTAPGLSRQFLKWPSFTDAALVERTPAPGDDVDDAAVQAELNALLDKHGADALLDMDKAATKAQNVHDAAAAAVARYFGVMGPAQRQEDGTAAGRHVTPSVVYTKDFGDGIIASLSKPLAEDTDEDLFGLDASVEPECGPAGGGQARGGAGAAADLPPITDVASIAARCAAAGLGVEQTAVATEVLTWAIADRDHAAKIGPEPPALRVLCLGGPGTGKCLRRPGLRACSSI